MTVPEAIAVLRAYNNWRRDNTGRVAFVDPVLMWGLKRKAPSLARRVVDEHERGEPRR